MPPLAALGLKKTTEYTEVLIRKSALLRGRFFRFMMLQQPRKGPQTKQRKMANKTSFFFGIERRI